MKSKIINIFAVCLITFTVLFPSLMVFGMVWEKHLNFVEMQQQIPSSHQSIKSEFFASKLQTDSLITDDFSNLYLGSNETNLRLYLFIPFCMVVTIYLYDKYLVHRANMHQQQVDMLEKLWQQSIEK